MSSTLINRQSGDRPPHSSSTSSSMNTQTLSQQQQQQQKQSSHTNVVRKPSVDNVDSDGEDKLIDESNIEDLVKELPQSSDKTVQFLDNMLAVLPNRWRNYIVRSIFTLLMVIGFGLVIYWGPLALMILV